MTTHLYDTLLHAFTVENLHKISSALISAYRDKKFAYLKDIARTVGRKIDQNEHRVNKIFSQLIMLYHPDRLGYYHREINASHKNGDLAGLATFSHILNVLRYIEKDAVAHQAQSSQRDAATAEREGEAAVILRDYLFEDEQFDFISALRHKEYGNLDVEYHEYDLVNVEGELELSGYNISDLSGLDLCSNLTALDLSNNNIFHIVQIGYLPLLEELDLSANHITNIDVLAGLRYLKKLDLSFNEIEDISALFDLYNLEYVNCIGNTIASEHINILRKRKILVIY